MTLTGDQTSGLIGLGQSLLCKDAPAVPHVQDGKTTLLQRDSLLNLPWVMQCELGKRVLTKVCVHSQPIFLNEVLVKLPTDPSGDEPLFHISHIDRVYTLRAESINER